MSEGKRTPIFVILIFIGLLFAVNYYFFREEPDDICKGSIASFQERHFKACSLGGEISVGIPLRIFEALPATFEHHMPVVLEKTGLSGEAKDYQAFGFQYEDNHDLPIGFAKKTIGYDRVTVNCALCHVASYRLKEDGDLNFAIGGPAQTVDVGAFLRFLKKVSQEKQEFFASEVMSTIRARDSSSWAFDWSIYRWLYRLIIIQPTQSRIAAQVRRLDWIHDQSTHWGPGRSDTINRIKVEVAGQDYDHSIGNVDFPAIWNLEQREGQALFWGGEVPSVEGAMLDHALALGAPKGVVTRRRIRAIRDFLAKQQAPQFPRDAIDWPKAKEGKAIFDERCAFCHGQDGRGKAEVVPIAVVGTDTERFKAWGQRNADILNDTLEGMNVIREPMARKKGYIAPPLDGVWLRAPYLHNGSVPNLKQLLTSPDLRRAAFYRGCNVYDLDRVEFSSRNRKCGGSPPDASWFDTRHTGNSNRGHPYGTSLPIRSKNQLIEYLKTL